MKKLVGRNFEIQDKPEYRGDIVVTMTDNSLYPHIPKGATVIVKRVDNAAEGKFVLGRLTENGDYCIDQYFSGGKIAEIVGVVLRSIVPIECLLGAIQKDKCNEKEQA